MEVTPAERAQQLVCPHCGSAFVVAGADGSTDMADEAPVPEQSAAARDEELDNVRIRQLMEKRVSANRRRAFARFGAAASLAGVVAAVIRLIAQPIGAWTLAYALLALMLVGLAIYLFRRSRALKAEAEQSKLPEPTTTPDFSTLGDGSQRWKELENLR